MAPPRSRARRTAWAALVIVGALLPTKHTAAQADYDTRSTHWNGLGTLVSLGVEVGVAVRVPDAVDVGALGPGDALLIVYPTRPLPRADLARFLHEGGRLAVADDFGTGAALLGAFEIGRHAPGAGDASRRLRDNRNLIVAEPRGAHPLTQGVSALVANHTQALHHQALAPVAVLGGGDDALVLVGSVGAGRLVAIGDGSMFINHMLEYPGNRAFARNLLRYLARDGRVVIAAGATPIHGAFDPVRGGSPLGAIRAEVDRLARLALPPGAVRALAGIVGLVVFLVALSSLPHRSRWLGTTRVETPLLPVRAATGARDSTHAGAVRGAGAKP